MKAPLALGLMLAAASTSASLDLTEGTLTGGGNISFNIASPDAPAAISNIPSSALHWKVSLLGGFLIYDYLEVNAAFTKSGTKGGFGVGAQYYVDLESIFYPYIGSLPTFSWTDGAPSFWSVRVPVSLGMLVGLNSHVAFDIGASAGFTWSLTGPQATGFDLGVGYMGLKSFF